MNCSPDDYIKFKRSRFSTRLPTDRMYSPSHYWMRETESGSGIWHVGFTKFATRMLGDLVEFDFEVKPDAVVQAGQVIGWIEAFKAVTDIYCVAAGTFLGTNKALDDDLELVQSDLYDKGWLYAVQCDPDETWMDVKAYSEVLGRTIDKMIEEE